MSEFEKNLENIRRNQEEIGQHNKKIEISFDDLWNLRQNLRWIKKEVDKIRKRTKSVYIKEMIIDEEIYDALAKNERIIDRYKL